MNGKGRKDGASGEAGIVRNTWTVAVKSVGAAILLRPIPTETGKPSGNGSDISIKVEELVKPTGLRNVCRQIAGAVVFVEGWATMDHPGHLDAPVTGKVGDRRALRPNLSRPGLQLTPWS